ncbi:MAG: AraC family ligand binding domain-containing protein [Oscillospiraceae bacterium]|nr:AraC family ligand binding domain-containing protein [Oscillospiraceae bacterium]
MDNYAQHISLSYGDIKLTFFNISLEHDRKREHLPILHRHSYYEVHFSGGGYYNYQFGEKAVSLLPNQIVIIPPDVMHHAIDLSSNAKIKPCVISFSISEPYGDKKLYNALISALAELSLKALEFGSESNEELMLFKKFDLFNSFLGVCKLKSIAADFTYKLFSLALKGKDFTVNDGKDIMVLIDNLINLPDISIKDIANATNYSERHISRLIKKHYGLTLSQIKQQTKG